MHARSATLRGLVSASPKVLVPAGPLIELVSTLARNFLKLLVYVADLNPRVFQLRL